MDLNATLDIIIKDLEETRNIIDDLKNFEGVPVLQIELAKSKCKSAAEMISLLKNIPLNKISNNTEKEGKPTLKTVISQTSPPATPVKELQKPHKQEVQEEIEKEMPGPEKTITESAIIADQFANIPESYNDTIGSLKREDDISEMLKSKPVSSLTEAIGINDKFLFIREIFNGDHDLYNSAIIRLDAAGNLSDANDLISGFAGGNADSEAVKQLLDLIKRKFPSNE
jgi:hypothetical protein